MVHQWMGLGDNEKMRADMLAGMGYVALAADVYGQGVRPKSVDESQREAGKFYGDRALFRARLAAGLSELKRQPMVDGARVADPWVKPEAVQGFVDEMEAASVDYQLIMYAGAVHAFTQKEAGNDPSKGAAYNEAADRRSWRAMGDFFAEIFER